MSTLVPAGTLILGGGDRRLWRGLTHPRPLWAFEADLAGSVMWLRVRWDGDGFDVSSVAGETDPADGQLDLLTRRSLDPSAPVPTHALYRDLVRWTLSRAVTLKLPYGRIARYQIERQIRSVGGEHRVYREGYFIVRGAVDD